MNTNPKSEIKHLRTDLLVKEIYLMTRATLEMLKVTDPYEQRVKMENVWNVTNITASTIYSGTPLIYLEK